MNSKKKAVIVISEFAIVMVLITFGLSRAFYQKSKTQEVDNVAATSCLDLSLVGENAINLQKAIPISDAEGMELTPFTFTVKNTCKMGVQYDINLESLLPSTLLDSSIKVSIDNKLDLYSEFEEVNPTIEDAKQSKRLMSGVLQNENDSDTYELRLWIDENAPETEQGKRFESKIVIVGSPAKTDNNSGGSTEPGDNNDDNNSGDSGETGDNGNSGSGNGSGDGGNGSESGEGQYIYTETTLGGGTPVLGDLVPITLNNDGTVRKADITKEWYRYNNKEWANAVILVDSYSNLVKKSMIRGNPVRETDYVLLDGVDDYISYEIDQEDFGNTVTVGIRVKFNALKEQLLYKVGNVTLSMNASNQIVFEITGTSGTKYQAIAATTIDTETVYSIVGAYDGENMRLYINGNLLYTTANTENIKTSGILTIGKKGSKYASMNVYEAFISDNYENTEEVQRWYSGNFRLNAKKVLDYQKFDGDFLPNEVIAENNIDGYFVWIPRYEYRIFELGDYEWDDIGNVNNYVESSQTIQIRFTDGDGSGICPSSQESSGNFSCGVGSWMVHPAFTAFGTSGLWVSKFQATNSTAELQSKPNQPALINMVASTAFTTAYNYRRDLDSHLIKNTEWGAVAYLSHSAYGINTAVRINNNSSFITGYSAVNAPTCIEVGSDCNQCGTQPEVTQPYNTPTGYLASTTGNITGVYDMAGGAFEITSTYIQKADIDTSTNNMLSNEAIANYDSKYFDSYKNIKNKNITGSQSGMTVTGQFIHRILGDATGELGPFFHTLTSGTKNNAFRSSWYHSYATSIHSLFTIYARGGYYGTGVNGTQFTFDARPASSVTAYHGFRFVLAPKLDD